MQRLVTVKQLHSFLGAVNYYRDMIHWTRAHILAPSAVLSGSTNTLKWTPECPLAFHAIGI
jgi:hypothetical protein